MSKLNQLLDAIVAKEAEAGGRIGPHALTVVKRKLPKKEESDRAYQVTVSTAQVAERVKPLAFGHRFKVTYVIEVTLITPNDHDALVYLKEHTDWREAVRARYMAPTPLPGLGVEQIDVVPAPFLDRSALADGYDYQQIALEICTYETRA